MVNDIRLRVIHFYRQNKKIVFIFISIVVILFIVNQYFKNREEKPIPKTTYEPHTSVIDSSSKVTKSSSQTIEEMIDEYMKYCNDSNWASAFKMLSDECKKYSFDNDLDEYMEYQYIKMPTPKKYAIQDYSNVGDLYIYQVKYTDDFLATGLTNSIYTYTEEKMVFKKLNNGKYEMAVGNYIDYHDLKNVFENEYIKVDLKSVVQFYSMEEYKIKFTNRTDYPIVIANNAEEKEICLGLASGDYRERLDATNEILIDPHDTIVKNFKFTKFYDNDDDSNNIYFNSIRVLEKYDGITTDLGEQEEIVNEQNIEEYNSIAKFSMNLPIKFKD